VPGACRRCRAGREPGGRPRGGRARRPRATRHAHTGSEAAPDASLSRAGDRRAPGPLAQPPGPRVGRLPVAGGGRPAPPRAASRPSPGSRRRRVVSGCSGSGVPRSRTTSGSGTSYDAEPVRATDGRRTRDASVPDGRRTGDASVPDGRPTVDARARPLRRTGDRRATLLCPTVPTVDRRAALLCPTVPTVRTADTSVPDGATELRRTGDGRMPGRGRPRPGAGEPRQLSGFAAGAEELPPARRGHTRGEGGAAGRSWSLATPPWPLPEGCSGDLPGHERTCAVTRSEKVASRV
jgi:hypothetical protein